MVYNDNLAKRYNAEISSLIASYFEQRTDKNQFPRELFDKFIESFDIFSSIVRDEDSILSEEFMTFIRLISKEFAAFSTVLLTQACYGIYPIIRYGSPKQKSLYLEKLIKGEILAGLGFSEGYLGENLELVNTTATKTSNGWRLSGKKSIVSNCRFTDILFIFAKVENDEKKQSFGFFIVDTKDPGVYFGEDIPKQGLKGLPISSVTFDNIELSEDSLLGMTLAGQEQLNDFVRKLQLGLSAVSIGISEGAFEKGLSFLKVKRGFGKRLIDATIYQHQFADLYTKLCAAEAYFNSYKNQMLDDSLYVSQIKLFTTKVAIEISEEIIRLIGPIQAQDKSPIDRYLKDAKTIESYGKSGDSIRKRIAHQWLKE